MLTSRSPRALGQQPELEPGALPVEHDGLQIRKRPLWRRLDHSLQLLRHAQLELQPGSQARELNNGARASEV